jgi:hypothetical protein
VTVPRRSPEFVFWADPIPTQHNATTPNACDIHPTFILRLRMSHLYKLAASQTISTWNLTSIE